ncbi:DUF6282 family protein [Muricomes intestini]|jgi:hypothetical protein|uniref:DUF6282 family protein n=1 Tax=Muricomes intestini TaxID=1796634 RepID=UPI002FE2903C
MGGINLAAVETAGKMGGKFVWFPTVDAKNDYEYRRKQSRDVPGSEGPSKLKKSVFWTTVN